MATPTPTKLKKDAPDPKKKRLEHLKNQERKALAKQERVKQWPKEHQEAANDRIAATLSNIREEMKSLA